MSFHSTPASTTAEKMASTPISIADLPSKRPNGCRPTPMMATSFMRQSSLDGFEGERDDLVAVVVSGERNHRQLDVHAELQLGRVVFGEPAFDTDDVLELNQPDAERHEVLTGCALVCGPGGKPCVVHGTRVPRRGSSTSDISPTLHFGQRDWAGNAVAPQLPQRLPISCGFLSGQVEISGANAFCMT